MMIAPSLQTTPESRIRRMAGMAVRITCSVGVAALLGALLLSVGTALLPLTGYHATVLDGGSMEPTIHSGALVITRAVPPASLQVGDVITYRRPEAQTSVTHRIVAEQVVDGQRAFTMKGDNNATADPIGISFSADTPRVVLSVSYAGYALAFLHSARGMFLLNFLPAIALAIVFVLGLRARKPAEAADPSRA